MNFSGSPLPTPRFALRAQICALDPPAGLGYPISFLFPMGQQYNKVIKRKRRVAYQKRRKLAAKAAATAAKAAKSSKKDKS